MVFDFFHLSTVEFPDMPFFELPPYRIFLGRLNFAHRSVIVEENRTKLRRKLESMRPALADYLTKKQRMAAFLAIVA